MKLDPRRVLVFLLALAALVLVVAGVQRLMWSRTRRLLEPPPQVVPPAPPAPVPPPIAPATEVPPDILPRGGAAFVLLDGVRVSLDTFLMALGRAIVFHDEEWLSALARKKLELEGDGLAALVGAVKGPANLFARVAAAELLGRMQWKEAVPALAEAVALASEPFLQDAALHALVHIGGNEALTAIADALPSFGDPGLRIRAARALASAPDEVAFQALLALLSDRDDRVRTEAALALGGRKDLRAVEPLIAAAANSSRADLFAAAIEGAVSIDPRAVTNAQVVQLLDGRPEVARELRARIDKTAGETRFSAPYPPGFFSEGGLPVRFVEGESSRIGVVIDPGRSGLDLAAIAGRVFAKSPFDRYGDFFFLRLAGEYEQDLSRGVPRPRAYDARGTFLPSGMPVSMMDAMFILRFTSLDQLMPGVSGVTRGREAEVTLDSLNHEVGHAFAQLADEYSDPRAADLAGANLDSRDASAPKWQALVDHAFLQRGRFVRAQVVDGKDTGKWIVPSDDCFMNNHPTDDRYCPVCQLEIIDRICRMTGAQRPW